MIAARCGVVDKLGGQLWHDVTPNITMTTEHNFREVHRFQTSSTLRGPTIFTEKSVALVQSSPQ